MRSPGATTPNACLGTNGAKLPASCFPLPSIVSVCFLSWGLRPESPGLPGERSEGCWWG